VIHGTTEVVDIPVKLNVVFCAEELLFTHTIVYLLSVVSMYADALTLEEGFSVQETRTAPGFMNLL
jgi:hypothetical protein